MAARAMARSMAAEMHSSFAALRRHHSMNIRRIYPATELLPEVQADVVRIFQIWPEARDRLRRAGAYPFGDWSAADCMFAQVVPRLVPYSLPLPRLAAPHSPAVITTP